MSGVRVDRSSSPAPHPHRRPRPVALALACLALIGLGVGIGSRIASRAPGRAAATAAITVVGLPAREGAGRTGKRLRPASGHPRTASGAVAAAASFVGALDGHALLLGSRVRAIIRSAAAPTTSGPLLAAYSRAEVQAREQLGLGTVPAPVLIVRAVSVGYRVDHFSPAAATVSIWRVGIVGSGATVQPEQSWRTETVSLVWLTGRWKIAALASQPGPTPPLAPSTVSSPAELFASIPRFAEFTVVDP